MEDYENEVKDMLEMVEKDLEGDDEFEGLSLHQMIEKLEDKIRALCKYHDFICKVAEAATKVNKLEEKKHLNKLHGHEKKNDQNKETS